MKMKRARYTHAHDRQARKPRRQLLFAGLFSVILLLFGAYGVASFVKDTALPSAETVPAQGGAPRTAFATPPPSPTAMPSVPVPATLTKDVQLAWPAVGQA